MKNIFAFYCSLMKKKTVCTGHHLLDGLKHCVCNTCWTSIVGWSFLSISYVGCQLWKEGLWCVVYALKVGCQLWYRVLHCVGITCWTTNMRWSDMLCLHHM
jgi:hypothetical protein